MDSLFANRCQSSWFKCILQIRAWDTKSAWKMKLWDIDLVTFALAVICVWPQNHSCLPASPFCPYPRAIFPPPFFSFRLTPSPVLSPLPSQFIIDSVRNLWPRDDVPRRFQWLPMIALRRRLEVLSRVFFSLSLLCSLSLCSSFHPTQPKSPSKMTLIKTFVIGLSLFLFFSHGSPPGTCSSQSFNRFIK